MKKMKRRTFLAGAGAMVAFSFAGCTIVKNIPVFPKRPMPDGEAAMGWIRFERGKYHLDLPRIEMGQNITTGLKQVACEELGIAWDELEVYAQQTASMERVRSTVGSESIFHFAIPLAQACATLRDALASGHAEAHTEGPLTLVERPLADLRLFGKDNKFVGKNPVIEQGHAIVTGAPLYAADKKLEGMLFGRILRAPIGGDIPSAPKKWNTKAAAAVPGFVAIVSEGIGPLGRAEGLGIVAATPGALNRIADALAVEWTSKKIDEEILAGALLNIDERPSDDTLPHTVWETGETEETDWDIDLRFDIPAAAHAAIEPRAAVAHFDTTGRLELWVGNQDIFFVRDSIAKDMGLDPSDVIVNAQRVGGAFGGKTVCMVELEAALLSRAVAAPVKVQWTREQEFAHAFHRPPSSHRVKVSLQDRKIATWRHRFVSSHILLTNAVAPEWLQSIAVTFIGDMGVARGAKLPYTVKNQRTDFDLKRLPYFTGPWRGLGAGPNVLVMESTIDECARRSDQDPIDFRLAHLEDDRLRKALERVREISGWPHRSDLPSSGIRRGWGVACGIYKETSYAATVASVLVSADGSVQIEHIWCVQDSGLIINPDQVRAQCEGNHVWGIGMVMTDSLSFEDLTISESQFSDAPIPRLNSVPPMTIELLDHGNPPAGAGETSIVSAAGALANALRDATGHRILKFPANPDDLADNARG